MQSDPQKYLIEGKAHCLQMCTQQELADPYRDKSHFERDSHGGGFEVAAVKQFMKSDAGKKNMDDPNSIRPPCVLRVTMDYLKNCVIDQDACPPGKSYYQYQRQPK